MKTFRGDLEVVLKKKNDRPMVRTVVFYLHLFFSDKIRLLT